MAPFRRVQAEFEAHLEPPHEMTGSARGKVEGGRVRLDVTNTDQKIPEIGPGDPIELRVGGRTHLRGGYRLD